MAADSDDRKRNRRTGWILLSIVLVFFLGAILRRWLYGA
ncbi:MAG TPA: cytochrome oxidase small assembly protein [Burkholderiaceae bacterium]|nr:cytochrome oxidase small assembly protein [Burkholderiaceae bacterium]